MSCGLAIRTRTFAHRAASGLSSVAVTPYLPASSCARSSRRHVTMISSTVRPPERIRPEMSASPILPPPRNATRFSVSLAVIVSRFSTSSPRAPAPGWTRRTTCSQAVRRAVASGTGTTRCRTGCRREPGTRAARGRPAGPGAHRTASGTPPVTSRLRRASTMRRTPSSIRGSCVATSIACPRANSVANSRRKLSSTSCFCVNTTSGGSR